LHYGEAEGRLEAVAEREENEVVVLLYSHALASSPIF
jgi:hypothetical protein